MTTFVGVGSPGSVGPTSGGKVYAFNNLDTTPIVVAPASQARTTIAFFNPGTVNIYVAPVNVQANNSIPSSITNSALTPSTSALGGCWLIPAGGGFIALTGECQGSYQAFAASGSNNPLTVTDSNV
jgi:hypothetical protein